MDNFESLKEIWLSEKADSLPVSADIKFAVEKYQSTKKRNIYLLILTVVLCFLATVSVAVFVEIRHWSRIFGEILIFGGVFMVLLLKLKTLRKANEDELKSNHDFLQSLKKNGEKNSKINFLQLITMFLIGIGYGFFIYQDIKDDQNLMLLSYIGILLFLVFMYLFFKPFAENISKRKSENLLNKINDLKNQI